MKWFDFQVGETVRFQVPKGHCAFPLYQDRIGTVKQIVGYEREYPGNLCVVFMDTQEEVWHFANYFEKVNDSH